MITKAMSDNSEPSEDNDSDVPSGLDDWLEPFFSDSALWPVVLVAAGCLGTLGAAVLVAALYVQNYAAIGALILLAWMSFDLASRNRSNGRFGVLGRCIIGLWLISATIGLAGVWLGLA